ncbi:MAG TPA: APC family permease [Fimbriimonadaceae bacterium]|nr:APC family permease [Fimbriimonadaceae bacterium]
MAALKSEPLPLRLRRILLGKPIPTHREQHERLSLFFGLPVFASDALSSAAYATEAIVSILVLASVTALGFQPALTLSICALYLIVVISYQQTVKEYPSGGGAYIVASDNLGERAGVVAASALLIDYVLTVAVSIAAGVAALVSAFPALHDYMIPMNVVFISLIAWANMRGVRESGMLFALPSYGFVLGMLGMIVVGVFKVWGADHPVQTIDADAGMVGSEAAFPLIFVLLRAFSAGCVALTGVEAISNGVPAFRPPEARNAVLSLRWLAAMMITMFLGTGFLIQYLPNLSLHATANPEYRTAVSQIATFVFGPASPGFFYIQIATATILVLAANTAFADFPRLSSILARDGYLPRPLARLGDRLVFQNGILVLAALAVALVVYFRGELDLLLPLYAVGVFTAFTLSQSGMVRHWLKKTTERGRIQKIMINGLGGLCTAVVAVVILTTKFAEGAWIVLFLMSGTSLGLVAIRRRYGSIADQLAVSPDAKPKALRQTAILLVPRVHQGIVTALDYAKSLHADVRGLHVTLDRKLVPQMRKDWEAHGGTVPLVVIESPYRSLIDPVLDYIDQMLDEDPDRLITVIVAEAVATKWHHRLLQENVAQQLKRSLGKRKNVVVSNVRYFLR